MQTYNIPSTTISVGFDWYLKTVLDNIINKWYSHFDEEDYNNHSDIMYDINMYNLAYHKVISIINNSVDKYNDIYEFLKSYEVTEFNRKFAKYGLNFDQILSIFGLPIVQIGIMGNSHKFEIFQLSPDSQKGIGIEDAEIQINPEYNIMRIYYAAMSENVVIVDGIWNGRDYKDISDTPTTTLEFNVIDEKPMICIPINKNLASIKDNSNDETIGDFEVYAFPTYKVYLLKGITNMQPIKLVLTFN